MALTSDQYSRLLQFLEQTDSYPHQPEEVKHIQTHISHVFMAGDYVYKIKKPVDFEFLDYSTLAKRKHFCEQEVTLNRRLCEDVYLGVVPIGRTGGTFALETQEADIVEYAVKMKKLDSEYFLHTLIERDNLTNDHLERVADKLASFYTAQQPDDQILQYGTIEKVKFNTDENFRQTRPYIGETIDQLSFDAIQAYTDSYFKWRKSLFQRRIEENRIVDGHGDLHLDHIHITPEKVRIYDCIEFNERFRYGDLAADLAFLAMDLDFRDRWREERYFVNRMADKLDDPDLPGILTFYKCYRAYVKGKVKSLQSGEEEVPRAERREAAGIARRYFDLSLRYALLGSEPTACIVMGRIGSGKSTLAEMMAETLSLPIFSSDRIRKSMAGLPLHERTPDETRPDLYSQAMSDKTYNELQQRAIEQLKQGTTVILDATYSDRQSRKNLVELLARHNMDYLFIEANASDETIKERLKKREGGQVVSDARLEDFEALDQNYTPPAEIAASHLLSVSTEQPFLDTREELYRKLVKRHLEKEKDT
ncbi:AAA family ATPase [Halalkalibaculum sp. DA3122]|uniref:bifunctional aminoglycoside phosphotransferase/ATP-binding protein n=1 Tax=Halalkalibaculum sp. DA3122 TaxID=3373607 RepID=UPI00375514D6